MRRLIIEIIFLLLLVPIHIKGQTVDDIGLITIGVGYPDNANEESVKYFDKLSKKVSKAITKNGCASYEYGQFQCIPEISVESIDIAEGGMKNVYDFKGIITVTAVDTSTGTVFNTFIDAIKGHATSKERAIANAINEANLNNLNNGIDGLKEKICAYYKKNKEILIQQAQSLANQGNFDEAIAELLQFPSVIVPDYYECLDIADAIYDQKIAELERQRIAAQRERNNAILTKANNAMSASRPEDALDILMDFEIGIEDQDNQYNKIRQSAQASISKEKRLEYERQERAYRDERSDKERDYELAHKRIDTQVQLENKRIDAKQQIANRKLDVVREQTQAAERVASQRIDALKKIALEVRKGNNTHN